MHACKLLAVFVAGASALQLDDITEVLILTKAFAPFSEPIESYNPSGGGDGGAPPDMGDSPTPADECCNGMDDGEYDECLGYSDGAYDGGDGAGAVRSCSIGGLDGGCLFCLCFFWVVSAAVARRREGGTRRIDAGS